MKGDSKFWPIVFIGLAIVVIYWASRSVSLISPLGPIGNATSTESGGSLLDLPFNTNSDITLSSGGGTADNTASTPTAPKINISLGAGNASYETDVNKEYITLSVDYDSDPVTISGWQLEAYRVSVTPSQTIMTSQGRVVIPLGAVLPTTYAPSAVAPIKLAAGERAIITSGESPKTYPANVNVSFKTNECTHYFDQGYDFVPSQDTPSCPWPSDEAKNLAVEDACVQYINSFYSCADPNLKNDSELNTFSNQCRQFIQDTFNYHGCVTRHSQDKDFYGTEWRIYLDRAQELWKKGDVIRLLDQNGKEVASTTLSF